MMFAANMPDLSTAVSLATILGLILALAAGLVAGDIVSVESNSDRKAIIAALAAMMITYAVVGVIAALIYHAQWVDYTRQLGGK